MDADMEHQMMHMADRIMPKVPLEIDLKNRQEPQDTKALNQFPVQQKEVFFLLNPLHPPTQNRNSL